MTEPVEASWVEVNLSQVARTPIPHEDLMDPDWRAEHEDEYARYGGSSAYITYLAQSMLEHGQLEAVELKVAGTTPEGETRYHIWDGNHRVAALAQAGIPTVQALIVTDAAPAATTQETP